MRSDRPGALAREIDRRGLGAPARLLLDAHRPLLPLLRDVGAFGAPLLRPLLGTRYMAVTSILDDPERYGDLIDELTSGDEDAHAEPR